MFALLIQGLPFPSSLLLYALVTRRKGSRMHQPLCTMRMKSLAKDSTGRKITDWVSYEPWPRFFQNSNYVIKITTYWFMPLTMVWRWFVTKGSCADR